MQDFFEKYQIKDEVVAVGISGGADSLALALRLKECGKKVVALTVDHGLRKESAEEAEYVAKVMKEQGIEHHILQWKGVKPTHGVEESAREARYRLLFDFCKNHHINVLATGHHLRDQAETFLLRLARGSGVFGLSSILPVSNREGIVIIRPQLEIAPEELRRYLNEKGVRWIEDPMNQDEDFMRVKIRKFLPRMKEIGIDEKRLSETAATLLKTRIFLQQKADEFIKNHVRLWEEAVAALSWKKLKNLPPEIALPVLGQLLQRIGNTPYVSEAEELQRVLENGDEFKGCTLGNCELLVAAKRLWIVPQDRTNRLMPKQEWDDFVKKHPVYRHCGFPYKVRRALKDKMRN